MDAHFSKLLGGTASALSSQSASQVPFMPATAFEGRREGYKFQKGSKGLGYYYDRLQVKASSLASTAEAVRAQDDGADARKRKREELEDEEGEEDGEEGKPSIDRLLEEAEANDIVQLDALSLKQLLLSFEKKITKNQKMRMKFPDEPEKFLESEMELHAEIQELYAVAASPELYPVLVQAGAVNSILGCLTHENTDISIAAIGLLQEMTEVDTLEDQLDEAEEFIDAFKQSQGLELVVQNLSRLNEASDEDAQGVQQSLSIIENLVELDASIAEYVCEKTHILKYLLTRCQAKSFDANKLYSSEILSILLQAHERVPLLLGALQELDGMEALLQSIALYRKKEVTIADEQECVENLFLSLCAALQPRSNQQRFLECEGFELMMRCLKEQQYVAGCTIPALSYAVMRNRACCARLVDVGGMKYIFPLLTGGGMKKALKRKGSGEKRNLEESALSIAAQLYCWLGQDFSSGSNGNNKSGDAADKAYPARLLNKLTEREHEKLERCVELYGKYARQLEAVDAEIDSTREALEREGDEEALEQFEDEDLLYARRLEGGLYNLQQVASLIAYACIFDPASYKKAVLRLATENATVEDVLTTLRDMLLTLQKTEQEEEEEGSARSVDEEVEREVARAYKAVVVQWCAALSKLVMDDSN